MIGILKIQQHCKMWTQKSVSRLLFISFSQVQLILKIQVKRAVHTALILKTNKETENEADVQELNKLDKSIVPHVKPPKPILRERKSSLPDHDVSRITSQSRKLELKASSLFEKLASSRGANKSTFLQAANIYIEQETLYRRGAVEFIYAGLSEMQRFGVVRDLDAYKALLKAFPEGKMIPRNVWQVEFMHYPRQQQCGIDMLEQMENNFVIPDADFSKLLKNRFGSAAHVTRKLRRMMYWLPKFKNQNPYPVPFELPNDSIELALLALKRMCVDFETKYSVFKTAEADAASKEDTFIVSAQSPVQQQLLSKHNFEQPLFVEGPYPVYLRNVGQQYFLLRAEPNVSALMKAKKHQKEEEKEDNLFEWTNFFEEERCQELQPILSVHEQEDSTVLGLCITGTSSKSSIVSWIHCLEKENPTLTKIPVLFKLVSLDKAIDVIGDSRPFRDLENV